MQMVDDEKQHIPKCDSYVVYLVRKSHKMKLQRFYQCFCQRVECGSFGTTNT